MGTRSLTIIQDEGQPLITLYRQYDGYIPGHGRELAQFLTSRTLVSGLQMGEKRQVANGAGCLAALLVAHFKTEPGNFYLYPAGTTDVGEEFVYTVNIGPDNRARVRVIEFGISYFGMPRFDDTDQGQCIFEGTLEEYVEFVEREIQTEKED